MTTLDDGSTPTQCRAIQHIVDTTRCADDDLNTAFETFHVVTNVRPANASVTGDTHVITECQDYLLDLEEVTVDQRRLGEIEDTTYLLSQFSSWCQD